MNKIFIFSIIFLVCISFVSSEIYDDCNIYGNCIPTLTTSGNTTNNYYNVTWSTNITNLSELDDTAISSPANGEVLTWSSAVMQWVNSAVASTSKWIFGSSPYWYNDSTTAYFNETHLNVTIDARASGLGDNASWNQTLATSLYSDIKWGYNQTQDSDNDWIIRNSTMDFNFNESMLSTIYYNATSVEIVRGTAQGSLSNTNHKDGNYDGITYNLTEQAGAVGLDVRINFTNGITDFTQGIMRYKLPILFGDGAIIQLWNYDDSAWEDYPTLIESPTFVTIEQSVFDSSDHVSSGVVQMRLYKSANGNTNNKYEIDWLAIAKGYGTPAGEEVDPYAIHKDGTSTVTANIDFGDNNISLGKNLTIGGASIIEDDNGNLHIW